MSIENSTPASDSSSNPGTTDAGQCSMASPLQAASSSTATASKPVDTAAPVGISQGGSQGSQPETDHCILGLDGQVWKPSQRATVVSWVPARWAIFEPSFKVSLATRPDDTKGASLGYALEEAPLLPQEPVEAPPAAPVLRGVPGCDGREWLPEDEAKWQVSALAPWSRAEFYGQLHKAHAVVDGSMIPEHGFVIRGPGWLLDEDRFGLQVAGDDQQEVVRLYVERWKLWASQHLASVGGHAKVSEDQATKMFFLAYDKHGPTRRAIAIPSLDEVRASLLRQHEFETGVLCDGEEAGSSAT